ncbi:MAG TPA: hypothetical protein VFO16_20925, partial [Pseudonocardiaceae bacterium]|nr:hypothetical protein [Pseudonocardiaceae bacterium]
MATYFLADREDQEDLVLDATQVAEWLSDAVSRRDIERPDDDPAAIAERIREEQKILLRGASVSSAPLRSHHGTGGGHG